jgi:hypothetical protein
MKALGRGQRGIGWLCRPRSRTVGAVGIALVVVIIASGCSIGSTHSSSASGASTSSSSSSKAALSSCVAQAKKEVQKYSTPVALTVPPLPTPLASLHSKGPIAYISATSEIPFLTTLYQSFLSGAHTAGLNVHLYDPGETIPNVEQALSTAVAAHSSVIVLVGYPLANLTVGIGQASAAHIPIVSAYESPVNPNVPPQMADVKYVMGPDTGTYAGLSGEIAAWYGLYATGCKLQIGDIDNGPGQAQLNDAAISALLRRWCPKTCTEYTANIPQTSAPTEYGTAAVTLVDSHPGIQYIFSTLLGYAQYILEGLKTAGDIPKVQVDMLGDTPWDTQNIQIKGNGYAAEVAEVQELPVGWEIMDCVLRTLGGGHGTELLPFELVINSSRYAADPFPSYDNNEYQATYKKAWGAK